MAESYVSTDGSDINSLLVAQLDVAVDGLEANSGAARLPDVGPKMLWIQPASERHLEIGVQRTVERLQVDICSEITTELDDDVPGNGREAHRSVGIQPPQFRTHVAVDAGRVDRPASGADFDFAVDRGGFDLRRCPIDGHRAVDRVHADSYTFRHEHSEFDGDIVVVIVVVIVAPVAPV